MSVYEVVILSTNDFNKRQEESQQKIEGEIESDFISEKRSKKLSNWYRKIIPIANRMSLKIRRKEVEHECSRAQE